jgi:hypothetical protein
MQASNAIFRSRAIRLVDVSDKKKGKNQEKFHGKTISYRYQQE